MIALNHRPNIPGNAKRVLILMSNTGGGHQTAANAIAEALTYLYGDAVTVDIVDAWRDHVAWPVNWSSYSYGWIVNKAVWLWKFFWLLEKKPNLVDTCLKLAYPLVAPGLLKLFQAYRPDVIVSVHPLITLLPLLVLKRAKLDLPFITVVTDMVHGYHTWYHPQTTLCLVSTEPAGQQAISLGIPPERVEVVGQPVALKFAGGIGEKTHLRRKLGLDLDRPAVLLVGGGEGYGPVFEIARCIARRVAPAQLIVVAGRNRSLQKKLEAVRWEIPTTIYGFVNNLPELMGAADVFISKAGPGSISEAFVAKLPLILFDYIPGQEEGNVHYVVQHHAGVYVPEPEKIAEQLREWLKPDNSSLAQMTHNAAGLARPEAALTMARRIYAQAGSAETKNNK
ncbi:MAG: glycosyltransferase [Anaerolineae bacterium]|nr:glycosyltransferase [Anaerolineae bacterium]